MIDDFLKHHKIPYPSHIDGWQEYEYVRIIRFKGDINADTLPKILEFKSKLDKAGLPEKNLILDGKKVKDVDSATIAVLLVEMKKENQKMALINIPDELKSYLEIFHQRDKLPVYENEADAVKDLDKERTTANYLPTITKTLKKNRALSLLISLVMFLILLPFFETSETAIIYLFFFAVVLLTGIYAVSTNMRHVAGGVLLATPTLITAWSNMFVKNQQVLNAEMAFLIIFLVYTLSVILWHILSAKKVTLNELYAAICVYIMMGMTFGVIFALLESVAPGSLSFPPEEGQPNMTAFFYFSFVSMSSTGFSGFTAASSFARALVVVQVIFGVMYITTLMGKLVSAITPDDDGLFDSLSQKKLKTDLWSQELTENFFRQRPILLVLSMAMLNYSGSVLMTMLHWPIFLDSWGTSLAVMLGGLRAGIAAGIIYNVVMAYTFWEPSYWVWMFCNILIAFLTWIFVKRGWIDLHKPLKLLGAGIICGVLNSFMVMIITVVAGMPIYEGTMAVYHFFMSLNGDSNFASIMEKGVVEIADKIISMILAAVAVIFIQDFLHWNTKKVGGSK